MNLRRTLDHLLPRFEGDPKLRAHLDRLGLGGLLTLGVVEFAASLAQYFGRGASGYLPQTVAMAGVGLLTLAARALWTRGHTRAVAAASALVAPAMLLLSEADDYTMAAVMLVLVTAVASVPFLPWHGFALGLAYEWMHVLSTETHHGDSHHMLLILLAFLATGIAASNHAHRRNEFAALQEAIRVAETLTGAQLRAQLAENAISIGKMAAVLSHEINSPLGVLRSSVDTLCALTDRQLDASPEARHRLDQTRADLRRSIGASAARIDEVTAHLRRFVSLEEAELKDADLNDLLTDVTLLHRDELERAHVRLVFDLARGLPLLNCRPQLLTAAFSSLLSNAIHAVNGDGRIVIETRGLEGEVQVAIRDNGRGMSAEEAETIFDPSFKVASGRVASGNWSLFNSRQIVYEHGGGIRLDTEPGKGTAVYITLPIV